MLCRVWEKGSFGKGVFWKRGLLEKGLFGKVRVLKILESREFRGSRDLKEPPECGKEKRIRPFSRDSRASRDFRDSRDSSSAKTPSRNDPFSGREDKAARGL